MQESRQNVITSGHVPQYQYRPSHNLGLPINSRLVSEAAPNVFLNNYQSYTPIVSPQQIYAQNPDPTAVRVSNVGYQSIANPITSYNIASPSPVISEQSNTFQTNLQAQRQTRNIVRSRLVPVTQYVPVYQLEQVQTVPQTIHQRVILHQPEAFKERTVFQQALPTLVEQYKVEQVPQQILNTKVVRVSQDPMIQTVPGGWRSKVAESKVSYASQPPLPREEKPCCSGWLFLLLGLLALGGVLAAILLAKNASGSSQQKNVTVASGTKVQSVGITKIQEVAPLTNASFEVRGRTAVTMPVSLQPTTTASSIPLSYVPATDISVVAKNQLITVQEQKVEPQKMNLVPITPVVVHPEIAAQTVQTIVQPTVQSSVKPIVISENRTTSYVNSVQPTVQQTVQPIVQPTVQPTAQPTVQSTVQSTVKPILITENRTTSYINSVPVTVQPTVQPTVITENRTTFSTASQINALPAQNITSVTKNSPVVTQNTTYASKLNTVTPQNLINQTKLTQPITVSSVPDTFASKNVSPVPATPITVNPQNATYNLTPTQTNKPIIPSNKTTVLQNNQTASVPAVEAPLKKK